MTVIDEVLAAEKASEQKIAEAKTASAAAVTAAKKEQLTAIEAEKTKLAEAEKAELATHATHVAGLAEKISKDAEAKVLSVETKFAQKAGSLVQKIKATLA